MGELKAVLDMKQPDIIALTETWTNSDISDGFLQLDGYELIVRKDREDTDRGRGGGVLVYVAKRICAWKVVAGGSFEQCASLMIKAKNQDLGIHVIYRSPNSSSDNDASLCDLIKELRGSYILIGDFNFPGIRWATGRTDAKSRAFYEVLEDNFLVQHVDEPTHKSGNTLDLVLSKDDQIVENIEYEGRLGKSDHEILMVTMGLRAVGGDKTPDSRNYDRANFDEMRKEMKEVHWEELLEQTDVETCWGIIKQFHDDLVDKWVPWRRKRKGRASPKWMNAEIRKSVTEKKKAWKRWKGSGREDDKVEYKRWETNTKRQIRNRKNAVEKQIARESKTNPKIFYSYVNSARRTRSVIGPLMIDGQLVVNSKDKSNAYNKYFSSVFTRCDNDPPAKEQLTGIGKLENVAMTEVSLKNEIVRLRKVAAPGPDNITNRTLIELCDEIARPLAILFTKSMECGLIPNDWRLSSVTPIYKGKGMKSQPGNYRPVSLTSNVCKLMEKVINRELSRHLENGVLNNSQHGFRRGRSCQTNLIEFFDKLTQWIDEGECVDVLYLDFQKAFDKVDHGRLMVKLAAAGIHGNLWRWIKDWLSGRKQRVVVNGETSDWLPIESGVLQGSVLGGPFFDVFIDDIDVAVLLAFLRKFADDTKMAKQIRSLEDAEQFQLDINNLCKWAEEWAMQFNQEKCKVMHLGRSNPRYAYSINGMQLNVTEEEKDLGVWTDSSLKPSLQCTKAANSANCVLGMILRSFHYRTKQSLVPLYTSLVRPKLEFAVAAWNPWLERDIECLEKVQKRLIRSLSNVKGQTYEEKLEDAGLTTLKDRRKRGDLIEAFKSLNGFNNVDKLAWFSIAESEATRPNTRLNTHVDGGTAQTRPCVLNRQRARMDIRNNCFRFRVQRSWNDLPDNVRQAQSTNAFKNAYDSWIMKNKLRNRADPLQTVNLTS